MVTKLEGPHTCVNALVGQDHRRVDAPALAKVFVEYVRENPEVKISQLHVTATREFNYTITRKRCWDARKLAIEQVYGN